MAHGVDTLSDLPVYGRQQNSLAERRGPKLEQSSRAQNLGRADQRPEGG